MLAITKKKAKKMMSSKGEPNRPHAVCLPIALQSHVKAMLMFAKLLYHKGFHITFVNTDFNHRRLLHARGPESLNCLPGFNFAAIPDGLPVSNPNASQDYRSLKLSNLLPPFLELLSNLNDTANSGVPPVSCIVSDGYMSISITAAQKIGVPLIHFFTISACSLMGFMQFQALKNKGLIPLKDKSYLKNGYLDTVVDCIPGMKDIRLKDLPSFIRATGPDDAKVIDAIIESMEINSKASAVVVHTFEALEKDVLQELSSMLPPVYSFGPIPLLLEKLSNDMALKSLGSNLWKEETEPFEWLNTKENNSVIYVNFGSIIVLSPEQLIEFAWGLANSKHQISWIIRPDVVRGDSAILPPDFIAETRERCFISSWCPQEEVLNHPSVGGFLTHCGWNSILESMCAGVPLLCWPNFADQPTNCRYSCREWGIGLEIDGEVKREEVESLVRELMEGEKGKKMKEKVVQWKKKAEKATSPDGSSFINFNRLVDEVMLPK